MDLINSIEALMVNGTFYLFKIFGIATISLKIIKLDRLQALYLLFNTSKIGFVINLILIFIIISSNLDSISNIFREDDLDGKLLVKVITTIPYFSYLLCVIFILLKYSVQQKQITILTNKINQVKMMTQKMSQSSTVTTAYSYTVQVVCFGNFLLFLFYLLQVNSYETSMTMKFFIIGFGASLFIVHLMILQYSLILEIMKNYFGFINESFSDIFKRYFSFHEDNNTYFNRVKSKIDDLITLHDNLIEICEETSKFYSLPMLWSAFNIFYILIAILFQDILASIQSSIGLQFGILHCCLIYFSLSSLIILTALASYTMIEVRHTCFINGYNFFNAQLGLAQVKTEIIIVLSACILIFIFLFTEQKNWKTY